jgi:hypothetical protein
MTDAPNVARLDKPFGLRSMEPTARCALSGEIKVSRPGYGPASRICYLQANEIVKTTARDYQERHGATFQAVARIWDKWLSTLTKSHTMLSQIEGVGPPVAVQHTPGGLFA